MKNRIILQVLALIAGALSVSPTARVELAQLGNRVAKFKKDHGLEGDEELTGALGAVLRAAEVAPVSADATTAQAQTAAHLEPSGEELDARNAAAGASGNSGLGAGGAGAGGSGSSAPVSNEEAAKALEDGNSKDDLLALAEQEGVEVKASANKADIAAAIVAKRNPQEPV